MIISWHFLYEPAIRFRIRVSNEDDKKEVVDIIEKELSDQKWINIIDKYEFGSHGEIGKVYSGEQELYGNRGWDIMQTFLETGSIIALYILEKGVEKPIDFYASRFLHCLMNQLGYHKNFDRVLWLDEALFYLSMHIGYLQATIDVGKSYFKDKNTLEKLEKSLKEIKKNFDSMLEYRRKLLERK